MTRVLLYQHGSRAQLPEVRAEVAAEVAEFTPLLARRPDEVEVVVAAHCFARGDEATLPIEQLRHHLTPAPWVDEALEGVARCAEIRHELFPKIVERFELAGWEAPSATNRALEYVRTRLHEVAQLPGTAPVCVAEFLETVDPPDSDEWRVLAETA